MIEVEVNVGWGDSYLDIHTYFNDEGTQWHLLSYLALDDLFGEHGITDADPEVCDDIPYGSFEPAEEIPPHLVDFINELNQKAHDRIALEKLKGRPQ